MPRASIVIPAYNATRCIRRAIESVLAQSEPDFEICVVDDGSADATAALVEAMAAADPRIRLLRAARNGGPGMARNLGIAAASGAWIALLDADDAWAPQRLASLLDLGERQDADMVADNLMRCMGDSPVRQAAMFTPEQLPALLGAQAFVDGNLYRPGRQRMALGYLKPLIRRSFLGAQHLAYDAARFSEDYLFYLRCLLHGAKWVLSPQPMYDYTINPHSLTAAHSAQDLRDLLAAERALLPLAAGDAALLGSLLRHVRAVERALAWFSFATACKQRDAGAALASLDRNPRNLLHIARESLRAAPRALAKIAG